LLTKPSKPPMIVGGNPLDVSRLTKKNITDAFERIGGLDRLTEEADKDPKWFLEKLWVKTMQPEKIEVSREKTVAEMLAELDAAMQNVTPNQVEGMVILDDDFEEEKE
jgi:hypothetical protein